MAMYISMKYAKWSSSLDFKVFEYERRVRLFESFTEV